jgi:hypothetical protein
MQPFNLPSNPADDAADRAALPAFLRDRPRRSGLSEPPASYFDELPVRLLTRIHTEELAQRKAAAAAPVFDLSRLRWPRLRLALASATLSAVFMGAFWLGRSAPLPGSDSVGNDIALAEISPTELVEYLADPATATLTAADLTRLSSTDHAADASLLSLPSADLEAALDELPLDETYL